VCPNSCIKHYGLERGLRQAWTPYIEPRDKGCTLCGECAKACPTGALVEFEPTRAGWKQGVEMGVARINEGQCLSFNGRTCGACYRACPLSGEAIKIGLFETPHVNPDVCVGCGLCEQACLHLPQAIRVESRELLQIRGKWSGREADTRDLRQEVRRDGGPDNGELDKERIEEGKT
jgi:ferredoxin